jgi:uncharacterized SAM-binding protein YcdF (DUF218 family)
MKQSSKKILTKLLNLVLKEKILKADAIICLEGDGQNRTKKALELFKNDFAPLIIVSGGYDNPPFSIVAFEMAEYLVKNGATKEKIIIEEISQNTREQAEEVLKIAQQKGFKKIILVASEFHQLRAYLTFLKVAEEFNLKILIINAPAEDEHKNLFNKELAKIEGYQKRGDVLEFEKALEYQTWKENQK